MTETPLAPGAEFRSYGRTITETDLVNFTGLAGLKLPIFIDDDYATNRGPYGGRIVPGFLTASLTAGMMESVLGSRIRAGLGFDKFRFTALVRPGDTIHARFRVESVRTSKAGTDDVVVLSIRAFNQRDEQVLEFLATVLMSRAG
ncbi:MaoC family dehydratase [Futiania mangrovi]|uniref:MaoC family dehydratase n=1 Tax=Futiania mangrovi TaxID=2959716 RepID=A0A9J6PEQ5_9PROT|nr:MaoC family dehydratase [Futiania mangrovii]MCP1336259.1 MaoC family dehydratase [Futiania mangrovii]